MIKKSKKYLDEKTYEKSLKSHISDQRFYERLYSVNQKFVTSRFKSWILELQRAHRKKKEERSYKKVERRGW